MRNELKFSTIAFGGSALLALVIAFAARIDVPQTVAATESVGEGSPFDDTWRDIGISVMKTASLADTEPKIVKTEVIEPTIIPPILISEEKLPTKSKFRRPRVEKSDLCTRHRMHKVHYGRKWRCR